MGKNKPNKDKQPGLEDRLRSIQQLYNEPVVATVFVQADGSIILGRVMGMRVAKLEQMFIGTEDDPDDDEGEQPKMNPLSMGEIVGDYIG